MDRTRGVHLGVRASSAPRFSRAQVAPGNPQGGRQPGGDAAPHGLRIRLIGRTTSPTVRPLASRVVDSAAFLRWSGTRILAGAVDPRRCRVMDRHPAPHRRWAAVNARSSVEGPQLRDGVCDTVP